LKKKKDKITTAPQNKLAKKDDRQVTYNNGHATEEG
jgi:hypothetical protein